MCSAAARPISRFGGQTLVMSGSGTALNPTIGTRLSAGANSAVVTGTGISVTLTNAALYSGQFEFDSKLNRHGEFGLITALTTPGNRLTLA